VKQQKILHVFYNDKFIQPFIDFIEENNIAGEHTYLYFGGFPEEDFAYHKGDNVYVFDYEKGIAERVKVSIRYFHKADKIILHSLINHYTVRFLFFQPWLLKKCYWRIWGGDLYYHIFEKKSKKYKLYEFFRKPVIKYMSYIITDVKGDYQLAQKWYKTKAKYFKSSIYPLDIYKNNFTRKLKEEKANSNYINILVGNSAHSSNNHFEVFDILKKYKDRNIKIYAPLSYGDKSYAQKVIQTGKKMFGDKFNPITEYMSLDNYNSLLNNIDIGIFAHNRQQALGNIITLLGFGKKVYLKRKITTWDNLKEYNLNIYDIKEFNLELLPKELADQNIEIIKRNFSKEKLLKDLNLLFSI